MMPVTHCDIGISPKMAAVMGTRPTIEYLCDTYDGGEDIRDSLSCIEQYRSLPAAVNCPLCVAVAEMIWRGVSLKMARKKAKTQKLSTKE